MQIPGPVIKYELKVEGFVEVNLDKGPLQFVAEAPGDILSRNTLPIVTKTNRRDIELQVALSPLVNDKDDTAFVPQNITCIALSPEERWARVAAKNGRLGKYVVRVRVKKGETRLHTAGRIKVSLDIRQGTTTGI